MTPIGRRCAAFLGLALFCLLTAIAPRAAAQIPPALGGPVDPAVLADLVVANHILSEQGALDAFGHVSIRHPTRPDRFLMSRSLAPALVTADDIMEFDLDGNPVDPRGRTSFLERFIHAEVYRARPDVQAVVHSHADAVIPFSVSTVPLRPVALVAAFLPQPVPVFDSRAAAGATGMLISTPALGHALAQALGTGSVALMRGHGMVVAASSLPL
ncbi:MAG: class II aldolase/adducin family protein, partial [Aliidongia sp.]